MNIFALSETPYEAARDHCDKHVVKMILEYGQMLSTSHRLLDGKLIEWQREDPDTGKIKKLKHWALPGEVCEPEYQKMYLGTEDEDGNPEYVSRWVVKVLNEKCYKVAHANHPCSVWARETDANYHWLFQLFDGCLREYTRRYGKVHSAERLKDFLKAAPKNVHRHQLTAFAQAMPEEYKHENAVEAYHRFYVGSKARFARWTNTAVPKWFINSMEGKDVSVFSRTR